MKTQRSLIVVAVMVIAISFGVLVTSKGTDSATIGQQSTLITTLAGDNTALRDQIDELGEKPVAPPAEFRVDELDAGATAAVGPAGRDGRDVTDDQVQREVTRYCLAHGCRGQDGTDGASSTVPGPAAQDGKDGTDGADGAPGAPGGPGGPGEPPASWTYTDTLGTHTCTRTEPFDAAAPTYTCTP